MFGVIKKYRREFFYTVVLFIVWEMAQIPEILGMSKVYSLYAFLGGVLILSWSITSYLSYSFKEVSRFTDVLLKIQLRDRFFLYFIMPLLLYLLATYYLYLSKSILLNQGVIIFVTAVYFTLFVHIRSTYEKVYSIAKYSRVIINFIDIVTFYLAISIVVMEGVHSDIRFASVIIFGAMLLLHQMVLHKQRSKNAFVILFLSLILLASATMLFFNYNLLLFPIALTLVFYLIISWWNIRLDGYTVIDEYVPPLLFTLMGFIVIMSF